MLALSGSSSKANYQTALRSVKYADSSGGSPNTGARTISFQVDDGHLMSNLSNTVTRNISVTANPPPTATDFAAVTNDETATDITVFPAHASDSDGDTLTVSGLDTAGTKGLATINPGNATIHYDPNGQFTSLPQGVTATDTFKYKVNDGFSDSSFATVTAPSPEPTRRRPPSTTPATRPTRTPGSATRRRCSPTTRTRTPAKAART